MLSSYYVCRLNLVYSQLHIKLFCKMWENQPSHVVKARINNCSVYHGSFHTLKGNGFLNDEVLANMWMFVVIMYNTIQIVNTYLKLLASIHGNCFVIISQVMTTIINRLPSNKMYHFFTKVCCYIYNQLL